MSLHRDGKARRGTARTDGKVLDEARKRKECTCPELAGEGDRGRLVVLGAEVRGRWSQETVDFLSSLAWAKVRDLPEEFQKDARRQTVVRALGLCRGEGFRPCGADGLIPSVHEVISDGRYGGV